MSYEWKIALRFLKDGKTQTLFILLGIAFGVAVQVFLNSLIVGLQNNLVDQTVGNGAHIVVQSSEGFGDTGNYINLPPKSTKLGDYSQIVERVDKQSGVTAVSPTLTGNALISRGGRDASLIIRGVDLQRANEIYNITGRIVSGNPELSANRVLVGLDFAKEYGVKVGDVLNLSVVAKPQQSFIVEGIYDLENAALNSSWVFMDIGRAQKLFGLDGYVNTIEIQVTDPFLADGISQELKGVYPELKIENWKELNASLLSALASQSGSSYTIQVFVLLAIALGISSVLAVSVVQKSKQIGILKAMGVTSNSASKIFIIQGAILGFLGAIAGIALGYILIQGFVFGTRGTGSLDFPIIVTFSNMVSITVISTVAGTVSSFIPARKSASLNPMEVIRNG